MNTMKTLIITLLIALAIAHHASAVECDTSGSKIAVTLPQATLEGGSVLQFLVDAPSVLPTTTLARYAAYINGTRVPILSVTTSSLHVVVPEGINPGEAIAWFCIDDGPFGSASITIEPQRPNMDSTYDKHDPNPRTNRGPKQDLSTTNRRPGAGTTRRYPNGGHGGTLSCSERHAVDGRFTPLSDGSTEWAGIPPMIGRFSHMYIDYCAQDGRMYLMNDWLIGTGTYERNCYNLFDFITGNGAESWRIKVTHDTLRPVIVELNGNDVTDDTTLVLGGKFGIGPSPADTTPHTIYEFAITVSGGLFMIPYGSDPVQYQSSVNVSLDCDESIAPEYGLIQEPRIRAAVLSRDGITAYQYDRYIPGGGVVGLEVEPNLISGEFGADTIRYRGGHSPFVTNTCGGTSNIDGVMSDGEWVGKRPINGMYSDLYAQYCNGRLHILNDWVLATAMPNNATCYNLFELFTGSGREHWGIWVYQDPERRPRVFRNGVEVSDDTTIVKAGKAGWSTSPRLAEPHAQYEFEIVALPGAFAMQFADPGPASYCSLEPSRANDGDEVRTMDAYPSPYAPSSGPLHLRGIQNIISLSVTDVRGRVIRASHHEVEGGVDVRLIDQVARGWYRVTATTASGVHAASILVAP